MILTRFLRTISLIRLNAIMYFDGSGYRVVVITPSTAPLAVDPRWVRSATVRLEPDRVNFREMQGRWPSPPLLLENQPPFRCH